MLPTVCDYRGVLRDAPAAIDVRAPAEFAQGSLPNAANLPLLEDAERAEVGAVYRRRGRDAAIAAGRRLVAGAAKEARMGAWLKFAAAHPKPLLYCARGGLRSQLVQRWLADAGAPTLRAEGGFKALRHCCIEVLAAAAARPFVLLGGRTGAGKTKLLQRLADAVDLEALARHRGSAFGAWTVPQPTPVNFENALARALLQHGEGRPVVLEDEARTIGRLAIPGPLFEAMRQAPIALLEVPTPTRIENVYRQYVCQAQAPERQLPEALRRIERRLGGDRYRRIAGLMDAAFAAAEAEAGEAHRRWIRALLADYYDPMYDYQLRAKEHRVVMRGDADAVCAYLSEAANGAAAQ